MLPIGSSGQEFGKKIYKCLLSGELENMSKTAVDVYKEKLNWTVWGQKVELIINTLLS